MKRRRRPWVLYLLALPAAVSIWSGWVELGAMTGYGTVRLLPGIADDFEINTAITLPIGLEAYAAYALGVAIDRGRTTRSRRFAALSALLALAIGSTGQICYHLLATGLDERYSAPWGVVVGVSVLPVVVLGLGAMLAHLVEQDNRERVPVERRRPAVEQDRVNAVPLVEQVQVNDAPAGVELVDQLVDEHPARAAVAAQSADALAYARQINDRHDPVPVPPVPAQHLLAGYGLSTAQVLGPVAVKGVASAQLGSPGAHAGGTAVPVPAAPAVDPVQAATEMIMAGVSRRVTARRTGIPLASVQRLAVKLRNQPTGTE